MKERIKKYTKKITAAILAAALAVPAALGGTAAYAADENIQVSFNVLNGSGEEPDLHWIQLFISSHPTNVSCKVHYVQIGDEPKQAAYCLEKEKASTWGDGARSDISNFLTEKQQKLCAIVQKYIMEDDLKAFEGVSNAEKRVYVQAAVWRIQEGTFNQLCYDGMLSQSKQRAVIDELIDRAEEEMDKYETRAYGFKLTANTDHYQELGVFEAALKTGRAKLKKVSAASGMTKGNSCYSLAGAKYGVYQSRADAQEDKGRLVTMTTKTKTTENGEDICYTEEAELPAGTYYVKELKASKGYRLDTKIHSITVETGETAELAVSEKPLNDPAAIELFKIDKDTGAAVAQGAASLAGAQFTVKYYAAPKNELPSSPARIWVIETKEEKDSKGAVHYKARLDNEHKASGDEFYYVDGTITLPLGTITVEETKAPKGYKKEGAYLQAKGSTEKIEGIYMAEILGKGDVASLTGGNIYTISDKAIYGGVRIQKRDRQSGDAEPEGGAALQGAVFEIINANDNAVVVDGKTCEPGKAAKTITTDETGLAQTTADCLPYGKYLLSEVSAPEGYLREGVTQQPFGITEDGKIVDLTDKEHSISDQVKRGDLEFVKIEGKTHKRMAKIPFRITSRTTGESHIAVTDDNGCFSTESSVNAHSSNTNANDGHTEDEAYDPFAGIWFGLDEAGENVAVDDELGALPYDTYLIEELSCKANEKHELVPAFEIRVSADKRVVKLGTVTNEIPDIPEGPEEIQIHTEAANKADGSKKVQDDDKVTIIDTVTLEGLKVGKDYRLIGWQMVKAENAELMIDGKRVENTVEFTADRRDKKVQVEFTFDASELGGSDLVTFEELYDITDPEEPQKAAEHKDIGDEGQTVQVEEQKLRIHTTAANKADGSKTVKADGKVTIVDTVTLEGLKIGGKYQLKGWQMRKDQNAELKADGKRVENTVEFTADQKDKEVKVEFTFDASELGGSDLVTFEELYDITNPEEPEKAAEHKDIEDEGQTVLVSDKEILIHTNATNKADGGKTIKADGKVTIVDTVTLKGLEIGREYRLLGWQMVKAKNAELKAGGKRVESSLTFQADAKDMEVQIEFTFDASESGGSDLVTFEELYDITEPEKPEKVAVHKDIEDKEQTVSVEKEKPSAPSKAAEIIKSVQTGITHHGALFALAASALAIAAAALLRCRKHPTDNGKL